MMNKFCMAVVPEDVDDLIFLNEPWTHSDR